MEKPEQNERPAQPSFVLQVASALQPWWNLYLGHTGAAYDWFHEKNQQLQE